MPNSQEQGAQTMDLVVTRVFDVPVDRVWRAWSDPDDVKRWWGPAGFTAPVAKMDFREGGTSLVGMRSPDGQVLYNTWSYQQIVPMSRIEFVLRFADENGTTIDPTQMGLPSEVARDVPHTVTLEAKSDNMTEMTVTEYGYMSDQVLELSKAGLEECLDKMAAIFATA